MINLLAFLILLMLGQTVSCPLGYSTDKQTLALNNQFTYITIDLLFPGQLRFSSKNVQMKIEKAIEQLDAIWDATRQIWKLKYDEGKSVLKPSDPIPVIKTSFGYVLLDGHHNILQSRAFNAQTAPINVIADWSDLSVDRFWERAKEEGYAYLIDLEGICRQPPSNFDQLEDDPNRYFAAITARKCKQAGDMENSIGAEYPLWIKVGKDIPFIEFKISDVLRSAGLFYTYEMGDNPPIEFVESARQALLKAQIPGLNVVPERLHYTQLHQVLKSS